MALSAAGLAVLAQAAIPGDGAPSAYGEMRVRNVAPAGTRDKAPVKAPVRVAAFAGDGIAEVDKMGTLTEVIREDFSLITSGSEEEPDMNSELSYLYGDPNYQYSWNNMREEFVHGEGRWGTNNTFAAGGMIYMNLADENNSQANLVCPLLDLTADGGTFVVEFRARAVRTPSAADLYPTILQVECAETHNFAPNWDDIDVPFVTDQITGEWRTYRLVFQEGGPYTLINIVGMGVGNGIYIDDVAVYSLKPDVAVPVLRNHSDFTGDSFVARWNEVEGAERYILSVYSIDPRTQEKSYFIDDEIIAAPADSYKVEDIDPELIYYYSVKAAKGDKISLAPVRDMEVFDIIAPELRTGRQINEEGTVYSCGVEPVSTAYGYSFYGMNRRVAEADGEFVVTRESFTGWTMEGYNGEEYTREHPCPTVIGGPYFPTDIRQQGWLGVNFNEYKDYLCLCPFFYTANPHGEQQATWQSPEFDLSKDGGKVSVDLRACADMWSYDGEDGNTYNVYANCAVALFNWNEDIADYVPADIVYIKDLNRNWADKHVELSGASDRTIVAFFALDSYEDMYIDDIVIKQNYKKGESFDDPFYFRTWQLSEVMDDPTTFEITVPDYASGMGFYNKAQAVRAHFDSQNRYIGYKASDFTQTEFVADVPYYNGVQLVENDLAGNVRVIDGILFISNPENLDVYVTAADGCRADLGNAPGLEFNPGAKGVYVVTIGTKSIKVLL